MIYWNSCWNSQAGGCSLGKIVLVEKITDDGRQGGVLVNAAVTKPVRSLKTDKLYRFPFAILVVMRRIVQFLCEADVYLVVVLGMQDQHWAFDTVQVIVCVQLNVLHSERPLHQTPHQRLQRTRVEFHKVLGQWIALELLHQGVEGCLQHQTIRTDTGVVQLNFTDGLGGQGGAQGVPPHQKLALFSDDLVFVHPLYHSDDIVNSSFLTWLAGFLGISEPTIVKRDDVVPAVSQFLSIKKVFILCMLPYYNMYIIH